MAQKQEPSERIIKFLKVAFINGIITILPFTFTIGVFMLSFKLVINWLKPIQDFIGDPIGFLAAIHYKAIANQLFLLILGILAIGIVIRALFLKRFMLQFEEILFKVPLVRPIYSGIKQLIHAFSIQDKISFKKVVLVEFPRAGIYSLGFLTSELPASIAPNEGKFYNVFIPTTPNPTSGYFIILPEKDFKEVDLTRQEAMAMIISGGIIQPERLLK
ncbi:DUF502 domain-containing protein [Candidatus Dependentiae bacterium]|nr:MAG: DUF502 domain-containing protein [Candidatus Dependentiae bacterium]